MFPEMPADTLGHYATCYSHIGQHSPCSKEWYAQTKPAKPEEYAELLQEIESIYSPEFTIKIVKQWTMKHDATLFSKITNNQQ